MAKVEVTGACWYWTAARIVGYGRFRTASGRFLPAHRLSYEHFVGPIPPGMHPDHLCRNPSGIRPDHLEPVTVRENLLRSSLTEAAKNAAKTHCPQGHPYDEANTLVSGRGRHCRACIRERDRRMVRGEWVQTPTPARQRTHCANGHPLSGESLLLRRGGKRRCRECQKAAMRRYYHRAKAQRPRMN